MTFKWLQRRSWDGVFRNRVPGVGSGDRKSSAADGSQSDWRHDQTVSSGRTQSSSTSDNTHSMSFVMKLLQPTDRTAAYTVAALLLDSLHTRRQRQTKQTLQPRSVVYYCAWYVRCGLKIRLQKSHSVCMQTYVNFRTAVSLCEIKTSRYSNDSDRPHRCCHLAINFTAHTGYPLYFTVDREVRYSI